MNNKKFVHISCEGAHCLSILCTFYVIIAHQFDFDLGLYLLASQVVYNKICSKYSISLFMSQKFLFPKTLLLPAFIFTPGHIRQNNPAKIMTLCIF